MQLACISDIHIITEGDAGDRCLQDFLSHPAVQDATHIGLLGDIFDLMAGDHPAYLQRYEKLFHRLGEMCAQGKTIFFAEGNHDMHLERLFKRVTKSWGLEAAHRFQIIYHEKIIDLNGKKVLLGHGDEFNRHDLTYLKYKKFIKRPIMSLIADYVMPLTVLDYLGVKASKKSRAYGGKTYNEEEVRGKFREGVQQRPGLEVDVIVGGHSHVVDEFSFRDTIYLNNGFPPKSRKFCLVNSGGARLVDF
jgi:UDP-2,3-diacylglucosamine hydrolase